MSVGDWIVRFLQLSASRSGSLEEGALRSAYRSCAWTGVDQLSACTKIADSSSKIGQGDLQSNMTPKAVTFRPLPHQPHPDPPEHQDSLRRLELPIPLSNRHAFPHSVPPRHCNIHIGGQIPSSPIYQLFASPPVPLSPRPKRKKPTIP